jgi:hypothetical protein
MSIARSLLILVAVSLACTLSAGEPAAPRQASHYRIDTALAAQSSIDLIALNEDRSALVDDGGARKTVGPLLELRRVGRALPPLLDRNFALLTNGDRIPLEVGAPVTLEKNRLHFAPAKSLPGAPKAIDLYAPHVAAVFWSLPAGIDDAGVFFNNLPQARPRDMVFLTNGDRLEGSLTALSAKAGCVIARSDGNAQFPLARIAAIAWNTDNQARLRSRRAYFRAVLEGGARLNFSQLRFDEKTRRWHGKTQFDAVLDMPEDALLALDERQGQAIDLADLKPTRYEYRPYLGAAWPWVRDKSASGHPLNIAGSNFESGLGTHASCSITYKLDGLYQRFDSEVGLDAEHSPRGRARVAVELDGKRVDLTAGKELTARSAPLPVRLDVRGVRSMTLIVDTGAFGDVQAEVNWAKARLVKK